MEELSNLRLQDATTKSLVFSQFVNFLDLIAYRLQKAGFNVRCSFFMGLSDMLNTSFADTRFAVWKERCHPKLEMPPSNTSVRFNPLLALVLAYSSVLVNNIDVTVFLVSLKAGGVALNLTEASRVYLMDSWWNPAVSTLLPPPSCFIFDKRFKS